MAGPRKTPEESALAKWGITPDEFRAMQERNRQFSIPQEILDKRSRKGSRAYQALSANAYDQLLGDDDSNWSDDRVGYVVTFYHAVVDPNTNYDSLRRKDGERRLSKGKPKSNRWQKLYLTKYGRSLNGRSNARGEYIRYAGIMSIDEYESRYGEL